MKLGTGDGSIFMISLFNFTILKDGIFQLVKGPIHKIFNRIQPLINEMYLWLFQVDILIFFRKSENRIPVTHLFLLRETGCPKFNLSFFFCCLTIRAIYALQPTAGAVRNTVFAHQTYRLGLFLVILLDCPVDHSTKVSFCKRVSGRK